MDIKTCGQKVILLMCLALTSYNIYDIYSIYKYHNKKKHAKIRKEEINDVIMFTNEHNKLIKCDYTNCFVTKSVSRLLYYLTSPSYSLDVCMYVLTNIDIANCLLKLCHKGIPIRLIVDVDMAFVNGSCVKYLSKAGVAVRGKKSNYFMHHKFCLIDASSDVDTITPFVMMGSCNWTYSATNGNCEDVMVTSKKVLVKQYREEFERLWLSFEPLVI